MATVYNTQYNIPRVQVQLPGKQNRLTDGEFRITPSMTEPVQFYIGNQDGVPLNLIPFELRFVVWKSVPNASDVIAMGSSEILLNKRILVNDPYAGMVEMVLTEEETLRMGHHAPGARLSWSLFMINEDDEVFPAQVSHHGGRYGNIYVDLASSMPIAEMIRTPTS